MATKCFVPDGTEALRMLERSLRELQTDYVDLAFVHSFGDDTMASEKVLSRRGTYAALRYAKAQGMTRFVGLSGGRTALDAGART